MARRTITTTRAPVLTLWASVVARRLGFTRAEALTLGQAVAGLNTYAKGRSLGLLAPSPKATGGRRQVLQGKPENTKNDSNNNPDSKKPGKRMQVDLLRRAVPVVRTRKGLRAH